MVLVLLVASASAWNQPARNILLDQGLWCMRVGGDTRLAGCTLR